MKKMTKWLAVMRKRMIFLLTAIMALGIVGCANNNGTVSKGDYDTSELVEIVYNDIDTVCDTKELASEGGHILSTMEEQDSLLISYVVDSAIEITKDALGEYDHLVIVNPAWINSFDNMNNLVTVGDDEITSELQQMISEHMVIWSIEGIEEPEGVSIYKYTGDGLLVFPANVGYSASAIEAKAPLIILIENPVETMKAAEFLLPMTSSGNIVFSDSELLQAEIKDSSISQYIDRVNNIELE